MGSTLLGLVSRNRGPANLRERADDEPGFGERERQRDIRVESGADVDEEPE